MELIEMPPAMLRELEALARKFGLVNVRLDGPDLLIEPAKVRRFRKDTRAVTMLEYGLLAAAIIVTVVPAMQYFANALSAQFLSMTCSMTGSC